MVGLVPDRFIEEGMINKMMRVCSGFDEDCE